MHLAVTDGPPMVYVSVKMGIPVNSQNFVSCLYFLVLLNYGMYHYSTISVKN